MLIQDIIKESLNEISQVLSKDPAIVDQLQVKQSSSGSWRIYTGKKTASGRYQVIGPVFQSQEQAQAWIQEQKQGLSRRKFFGRLFKGGIAAAIAAGVINAYLVDDPPVEKQTTKKPQASTKDQPATPMMAVYTISGLAYDLAKDGVRKEIALRSIDKSYSGVWRDIGIQAVHEAYTPLGQKIDRLSFQKFIWLQVETEYYRQTGKQLQN